MKTKYLDYQISYLRTLKHDGSLSQEGQETLDEYLAIKEALNPQESPSAVNCNKVEHNLGVILDGSCKKCGLYYTI